MEGDSLACIIEPDDGDLTDPGLETDIVVKLNYMKYCPPVDTILTNTFKITKTKTITMLGQGLEFGLRNTVWLGTEEVAPGEFEPLGIVKDQLEIRWGEPYWEEYGSGWDILSRIELSSLLQAESESPSLFRIFQPIQHLSLNKLGNEEKFDHEPYIVNSSYGIQRLVPPNEK